MIRCLRGKDMRNEVSYITFLTLSARNTRLLISSKSADTKDYALN